MLREELFLALHEPAHHDYQATLRRIAQRFWWQHVRAYVGVRQVVQSSRSRPKRESVASCAVGPFPSRSVIRVALHRHWSGQGSLSLGPWPKSILTMIDEFTTSTEAVPIVDQSAATVARAVNNERFARYGVPEQLHSFRGTQFEAALFAIWCYIFVTDQTRTTFYRPQANGTCERCNRKLVAMLCCAVEKRLFDWKPLLAPVR